MDAGKDSELKMKVSVVMPVYNGGEIMRRAIDSVLAQTHKDFDFVCIDDGSTDGVSAGILDEYASKDSRITVVHRANKGVPETLKEGYSLARGDFVAHIDQDDIFHPQLLEYCIKAATRHKLDFLSFRYATIHGEMNMPFAYVMGGIDRLMVWDSQAKAADPRGYCVAMAIVHTDTWAHFVRKDLMLKYPFGVEWWLTRLFAQLKEPIRWASSMDVLYFYDAGVDTSMTHRPFSLKEMTWDVKDIEHLHALYAEDIKNGDPSGEWETVCRVYVVRYLKMNYNKIRHSRGVLDKEELAKLLLAFAQWIHVVFEVWKMPFRYVKFKQLIAYKWLLFKYCKILDTARSEA